LPQIASLSNYHIRVNKIEVGDRIESILSVLSDDEKKQEIAKLLSTDSIEAIAIENANLMINN